jgi:hypothetical protein
MRTRNIISLELMEWITLSLRVYCGGAHFGIRRLTWGPMTNEIQIQVPDRWAFDCGYVSLIVELWFLNGLMRRLRLLRT